MTGQAGQAAQAAEAGHIIISDVVCILSDGVGTDKTYITLKYNRQNR